MSNHVIWKALWWVCLVVAPVVLICIELFHPANFTRTATSPHAPGMYEYLHKPEAYNPTFQALAYPGPDWWVVLHMIQTPMVALVAVGLWLLAARVDDPDGVRGACPRLARARRDLRVRRLLHGARFDRRLRRSDGRSSPPSG